MPPARHYFSFLWDPTDDQILLFGGSDRSKYGDLWSYRPSDNRWTKITPSGGTGPVRIMHTAVWDTTQNRMLVFGGDGDGTGDVVSNEIWSYTPDQNIWMLLEPNGPQPSPRDLHTSVWDPKHDQMIVFGGKSGNCVDNLDDLWSYRSSGNTWVQVDPSGSRPAPRHGHSAIWDPVNEQMLVFGGWDCQRDSFFNDLWSYSPDTNTWSQLAPSGRLIPPRFRQSAVWDPVSHRMLIFGGCCGPQGFRDDLWGYDPSTNNWTQLTPTRPIPPGRNRHAAVWDPMTDEMLIFAGLGQCFLLSDLWSYRPQTNAWNRLTSMGATSLPALEGHSAVWAETGDQLLVFGGCDGSSLKDELWSYRPSDNVWTRPSPVGSQPPPRTEHSAVWSRATREMLVFGGSGEKGTLDDLWSYRPDNNTWIRLAPEEPTPPARHDHSAVWDRTRAQMLIFGGKDARGSFLNDLWAYSPDTNTWVQLTTTGAEPEPRTFHSSVWDPTRDRMLMFGGWNQDLGGTMLKTEFSQLWSYEPSSNAWIELDPHGPIPAPRYSLSLIWDPTGDQMLMFGGFKFEIRIKGEPTFLSELWSYRPDTESWTELILVAPTPAERFNHVAIWDSVQARMIIVSGFGGVHLSDLWSYQSTNNTWTQLTPRQ